MQLSRRTLINRLGTTGIEPSALVALVSARGMEDAVAQDFAGSCPYDEIVGTMDEMVRATHTFEKVLG